MPIVLTQPFPGSAFIIAAKSSATSAPRAAHRNPSWRTLARMSEPLEPPTQSLVTDDAGRKLRSRKLRVEVTAGPQAGRVAELPGPVARVGSGEGCELKLDDPTVSRHHLTLRIDS